jgi:NAD(P)-dependent dehydrogenase (short-subunit alcohol dehydrogenase family)
MAFQLSGKTALVTGAAHGIGKAISVALAEAGASVLLTDIDDEAGESAAAEIRARAQSASYRSADVANVEHVQRAVELAVQATGRLDILCNNAAHLVFQELLETLPREWDRSIAVSLSGAANFIRASLPHMIRQGSGSIINIASVQGLVGGRTSAAYTAGKTGMIGLTRSVAFDYGGHGIRVNAVCPGAIRTRISPAEGSELHARQIGKTMLGRTGEPREVAAAVLFLASDEASYITGAILAVDGGWTAM